MTTICCKNHEGYISNYIRTHLLEDDFLNGTTFSHHTKVKKHIYPWIIFGSVSYGSSKVTIDLVNSYNNYMHIPTYTRFKLKGDTKIKPIICNPAIVSEPEEKEFSFKPFPVRKYALKVKIASIKKGIHKFQPFNNYH